MNPLTFYKYGTYGLLIMNIMMLAFFFFSRPRPPHPNSRHFTTKAMDILKLDENQRTVFMDSADKHARQLRLLNEDNRRLVEQFFLSDESTDTLLVKRIQELESQKLLFTQTHFKEIKDMLKPDQVKHFESFKRKALGTILRQRPRDRPPRYTPLGHEK